MSWLWWIGIALVLGILEMVSVALVLVMLAGGALAGALAAALGASLGLQVVVAGVVSALLLATLRPWLLRHWRNRVPLTETNATAYVGRAAQVVSPVTDTEGRIKIGGVVWTARSASGARIEPGEDAVVVRIDGATALVEPSDRAAGSGSDRDRQTPTRP
ncbi:hypothetical protein CELL_03116 [Cellulomonas sp. T2.31MG-18]|uniref:NfeD family protein n=1 Tax=Cellulomonas sp. T2.31MG-18 TaxID=3157619 RepID=UPI0035E74007